MSKLLTVIIPCYNYGQYIERAIQSVLENDENNICEIIIINDGSDDLKTLEILESISNDKVIVHHQSNCGLAAARNKGIELSSNENLLFLDADNSIKKDFIKTFENFIVSEFDFDVIYGNLEYFGEKVGIAKPGDLNIFKLFKNNYIDACAIVKKSTLLEVGKYDEKMPFMGWEDWDLWIRMALAQKKMIYVDKILFEYRYASNSMIRTIGHKENEIRKYLMNKYGLPFFDINYLNSILNEAMEERLNNNFPFRKLISSLICRLMKIIGIQRKIQLTDNFL